MSTLETLEVMQSDVITMHQKAVVLCSFLISGISPAALMNSKFFPVAIASELQVCQFITVTVPRTFIQYKNMHNILIMYCLSWHFF